MPKKKVVLPRELAMQVQQGLEELLSASVCYSVARSTHYGTRKRTEKIRARTTRRLHKAARKYHELLIISTIKLATK